MRGHYSIYWNIQCKRFPIKQKINTYVICSQYSGYFRTNEHQQNGTYRSIIEDHTPQHHSASQTQPGEVHAENTTVTLQHHQEYILPNEFCCGIALNGFETAGPV